jgi:hypothetical protein
VGKCVSGMLINWPTFFLSWLPTVFYTLQNRYQLLSTQLIHYMVDVFSVISNCNFYPAHLVLCVLDSIYQLLSTQFIITN